jgi:catechol 2,3-dioxygenase-like lactoylglutathione lyase family enzyme
VPLDLFAGIPVSDYDQAVAWYTRLFGAGPSAFPKAGEAVWELAGHRMVYIDERPDHAGHAMHTLIVDDLDAIMGGISGRGIEPSTEETYASGVRKTTYRDPDGNEIGFGSLPASDPE